MIKTGFTYIDGSQYKKVHSSHKKPPQNNLQRHIVISLITPPVFQNSLLVVLRLRLKHPCIDSAGDAHQLVVTAIFRNLSVGEYRYPVTKTAA